MAYLAVLQPLPQLGKPCLDSSIHACSTTRASYSSLVNAFTACRGLAGLLRALYLTDACLSQTTCYNGAASPPHLSAAIYVSPLMTLGALCDLLC